MASLSSLRSDKLRRLTTVPDDFLSKIPRAESQLFDEIVSILAQMEVVDGAYAITTANLNFTAQIAELLKEALTRTEYLEAVAEFAKEFDSQAVVNDDLFRKAFPGEFTGSAVATQAVNIAKRNTVEALLDKEYDTRLIQPLRETIEAAVVNGAGFRETMESIREFIEGTEDREGQLTRYSRVWAHDAFAIADRSYTSIVSEEVDADWFFYSGDTIDTSREFCIERHNQYFHWKEIESWFTGSPQPDRSWESKPWPGMIPGTDADTFYSYAGGYNCLHSVIPVSLYAVPLDVVRRNISSGNFEPTENQIKRLGL